MRKLVLAGLAAIVAAAPAFAQKDDRGGGPHAGHEQQAKGKPDRGAERGRGPAAAMRVDDGRREARKAARGREPQGDRPGREARIARPDRDLRNARDVRVVRDVRGSRDAGDVRDARRGANLVRYADRGRDRDRQRGLVDGCPPGLARKHNGCMPPGQARKLANWYGFSNLYRDDARTRWLMSDGYMYRLDPASSLVTGFVPLVGGALFAGNVWPTGYSGYAVDPYQARYFGYDDDYDYRYADGALFAVDPETQAINGIAGLLTGDDWRVGSAMPLGYDFYNVPPSYRDRYIDSDEAMYRYSDGYVYQVDPTTLLVQKVIELML